MATTRNRLRPLVVIVLLAVIVVVLYYSIGWCNDTIPKQTWQGGLWIGWWGLFEGGVSGEL